MKVSARSQSSALLALLLPALTSARAAPVPDGEAGGAAAQRHIFPGNVAAALADQDRAPAAVAAGASPTAEPFDKTRGGRELARMYRACAPGVVLILAADGDSAGTGFFIDPAGWILSNHHVVQGARIGADLTREVTVFTGTLSPEGQMKPNKEQKITAKLHKWDRKRDLALLKVVSTNPVVPAVVALCTNETPVGEDVAAIGHRGIGLMWGMKPGNVVAIGKQSDNVGLMQMWEKQTAEALAKGGGAKPLTFDAVKTEVEQAMRQYKDVLLVEATCATAPGDSGGPLLNMAGQAVGITSFGRSSADGNWASYFIHGSEIGAFLKDRPAQPLVEIPSLWTTMPCAADALDLSKDRIVDTLVCFGLDADPQQKAVFSFVSAMGWDLDQDSGIAPGASPAKLFTDARMDFELYAVRQGRATFVAYDLDNDQYFERVLMQPAADGAVMDFSSAGRDRPYVLQNQSGATTPFLGAKDIPERWRQKYLELVSQSRKLWSKRNRANPWSGEPDLAGAD